jgi:aminodeoxyfutalosine deaminase
LRHAGSVDITEFVAALPKTELHLHLVGSAAPETVLTLARERHGVELGWIFDADAALGPPGAAETVEFAVRHRPAGTVGIGLAGPEVGLRRADFAPAFRAARDAGLHSDPHAGETVGPAEVWAAVRGLGAERIGHGIGAAADPALLDHLASHGIALEVCPTSNVCTGAVPSLREHPLPALLAAGVPVTLATDDPGMFHTTLNDEYLRCHQEFGLSAADLAELARAGARAAFCPEDTRRAILAEIDALA